jgi:hypothetical protein
MRRLIPAAVGRVMLSVHYGEKIACRHGNLAQHRPTLGRRPRQGWSGGRPGRRGSEHSAPRVSSMIAARRSPRCWLCGRMSSRTRVPAGVTGYSPGSGRRCARSAGAACQGTGPTILRGTLSCCGSTGKSWLRLGAGRKTMRQANTPRRCEPRGESSEL